MSSPGSIWPVSPIFNAGSVPLSKQPGTLPNMADTIMGWFQLLTFEKVTKTVDATFQVVETTTPIAFQGVVMRLTAQQLRMKPEGQRSWQWNQIYALPVVSLKPDDVLITQDGLHYRVMEKLDYSQYGYISYHVIEDFNPPTPTGGA